MNIFEAYNSTKRALESAGIEDYVFEAKQIIKHITGFSNSIVSPAMEFKKEGFVMGIGSKMFTIAGPVLVYGISTSIVIGIIYYILILTGVMGV